MAIESRELRNFVVLAEELHFARAAARLGVAQSALSGSLARLEDIIGGRLMERGRRAVVRLTPLGEIFLGEAQAAVHQLDRTEQIGKHASRGEAGPWRLSYVLSAALSGTLTKALAAARDALPFLDVVASPLDTPEQLSALDKGRVDAGLLRPQDRYPEGISARVVHREPFLLAVSRDHPLASRTLPRAAELADETFIVPQVARSVELGMRVAEVGQIGGFGRPQIRDCADFLTAASMAAAGLGVVLAPQSLPRFALQGLVYLPIADFHGEVELVLAWRGKESSLVRTIIDKCAN